MAAKFLYRVKGANTLINHSDVDDATGQRIEAMLKEGDEVRLPLRVALELRNQLEPLEEAGRFEETDAPLEIAPLAAHEREEILAARETELKEKLEAVQAELATVRGNVKKEIEARAAKARAAHQAASKPEEKPVAQDTTAKA